MFKLAAALEVSPEWLRGLDVPMEPCPGATERPVTSDLMKLWNQYSDKVQRVSALLDLVRKEFGVNVSRLLVAYLQLNDDGKKRAFEAVQDLGALENTGRS